MTRLTITTSIELTSQEKAAIEKSFSAKYGRIKATYHVNDELIGGIMVFDGDKVYDGSIRTQLDKIKERIKI